MTSKPGKLRLGVNIDHVATLRQARGTTYPDLVQAARRELRALCAGARLAHEMGLIVNAGHGINLKNIAGIREIPHLDTLNIGHSIICHSVFVGLNRAVRDMLSAMKPYQGGRP